jgi:uncharacterized protein YecE (DUF72 family)
MVHVLTGTSGWSYEAWRGSFYPAGLPADEMLAAYAARLPTVEVNNSFYRLPRASVLAGWRARVPAGFVFALKAPRRITHIQKLAGIEGLVEAFRTNAAELGEGLGVLYFQLPPTMKKDVPRLRDLLALLPRGLAAVELKHPSWRSDDALQALADASTALVVSEDEGGAGPVVPTGPLGYFRLRRPDYDDRMLTAWAEGILAQPWDRAFVFFKHEDEAMGPAFAMRFAKIVGAPLTPAAGPPGP